MWISSLFVLLVMSPGVRGAAIDLLDPSMGPWSANYCNDSSLLVGAGLVKSTLGQFLGYECSPDFFHCRWQSDGFYTYKKSCRVGLVYDTSGTQNCNYDYNVRGCKITKGASCLEGEFTCPMSESCVPMAQRCDGRYDCAMEEDEQNCPLCGAGEFACVVSEQCIPLERRCNGLAECGDGSDEVNCDVCGPGHYHCGKSGECIPGEQRCDGRRNCPHGEDEMMCRAKPAEKRFTCESRDAYVAMNQVCDGIPNCPDGSDETYCEAYSIPRVEPQRPALSLSSMGGQPQRPAPAFPSTRTPPPIEELIVEESEEKTERKGPLFPVLNIKFPMTTTKPLRLAKGPASTRAAPARLAPTTPPPTLIAEIIPMEETSTTMRPPTTTARRTTTTIVRPTSTVSHATLMRLSSSSAIPQVQKVPTIILKLFETISTFGTPLPPRRASTTKNTSPPTTQPSTTSPRTTTTTTTKRVTTPLSTTTPRPTTTTTRRTTTVTTTTTGRPSAAPAIGRSRYPMAVDSSEERVSVAPRRAAAVEPRSQTVRKLRDRGTKPEEAPLSSLRPSTVFDETPYFSPDPTILAMRDDVSEGQFETTTRRASRRYSQTDILKKIGAKLKAQKGRAVSSRSLMTQIEAVLEEELSPIFRALEDEARSAEKERTQTQERTREVKTTTSKPQFSFKIL